MMGRGLTEGTELVGGNGHGGRVGTVKMLEGGEAVSLLTGGVMGCDLMLSVEGPLVAAVMEVGNDGVGSSPTSVGWSCPQHVCGNVPTKLAMPLEPCGSARVENSDILADLPGDASSSGLAGAPSPVGDAPMGSAPFSSSSQGPLPNPWMVKHCREIVFTDSRSDFVAEGGMTVQVDLPDVAVCEARLEAALVGRVFGRAWTFTPLCRELKKLWSKFGQFHVNMFGPNCFICFFGSKEVRDVILHGGSWFVAGQLIGVNKWSTSFDPSSAAGLSSPI